MAFVLPAQKTREKLNEALSGQWMPDQREANGNRGQERAAHVSIAWLLANWWLHGSLHIHKQIGVFISKPRNF